jgi:plastocyanin
VIRRKDLIHLGVAAIIAASLVSCSDGDDDGITDVPDDCRDLATAAGVPQGAALVAIKDLEFEPDTLRIARNTTVYWINCEEQANVFHTVSAVDGTWASQQFTRGQTYSRAFPQAVPHPYYSVTHPTARGTVLVN